ncbi:MAG: NosD domain-containing protein, partial [Polyangiales bacterium]
MFGLIFIAACASQDAPPLSALVVQPAPPRPSDCETVAAGSLLQPIVDGAQEGATLCLEPGSYAGPLTVAKRVAIWGPLDAVIRSAGEGTTIQIEGNGAALAGLTVDGSGGRFDTLDAAVHVVADDVRVEGIRVQGAAFGLLIEKANRASILNNIVHGPDDGPLGLRGDGIRLWETRDSVVRDNQVIGCRDMVVWYSSRNRLVRNTVVRSRYGTHFMYSHDNHVEGNRYIDNVVGIFIMYSR